MDIRSATTHKEGCFLAAVQGSGEPGAGKRSSASLHCLVGRQPEMSPRHHSLFNKHRLRCNYLAWWRRLMQALTPRQYILRETMTHRTLLAREG